MSVTRLVLAFYALARHSLIPLSTQAALHIAKQVFMEMLMFTIVESTPSADLISRHIHLVRQVVVRMLRRLPPNVQRGDLMAAGVLGLIDALRKNGGDQGGAFESYARIRIRGSILDELRTQDWLPRRTRWALSQDNKDSNVIPISILGFDDLTHGDQPVDVADDNHEDAASLLEKEDERTTVEHAIAKLPEREQVIIRMHYFSGVRFRDIGEQLGVSEPRVSQLHTRAMKQLREILEENHA